MPAWVEGPETRAASMNESALPPIFPACTRRMRVPSLPGVKELLGASTTPQAQAYTPTHQPHKSSSVTSVGISLERYSLSDRIGREGTRSAEREAGASSSTYTPGPVLSPIGPLAPLSHRHDPYTSAAEPSRWSPVELGARGWHAYDPYQGQSTSPTDVDPCASSSRSSWNARLQGVKIIPGYGDYFVYDDGSFIPTQVDGHRVNPDWGLTKQQKARKRLPKACTRCHKKKQRCEPLEGGCVQCKKVNKPCDL